MSRAPNILNATRLARSLNTDQAHIGNGRYVPARPINGEGLIRRIEAAWLVFTGKADALEWEQQP